MIKVFPDTWEKQYYLNNTDHSYCGFDNDIDALEVWNLTRGCANITVAVIDDGVEDHSDLRDDAGNTRVLDGFTPSGVTTNGRPGTGDKHGQACAGIIAASHNANIHGIALILGYFLLKLDLVLESLQVNMLVLYAGLIRMEQIY